jgi:hypothetical protein
MTITFLIRESVPATPRRDSPAVCDMGGDETTQTFPRSGSGCLDVGFATAQERDMSYCGDLAEIETETT